MNKDIIRMAREAGMGGMLTDVVCTHAELERFAELVAAHTLSHIDPSSFMSWQEGYEAGKLAEREACAEVCERLKTTGVRYEVEIGAYNSGLIDCAYAIRARGNK